MCSETHFHCLLLCYDVQNNDSHKRKEKCPLRLHRTGTMNKTLPGKFLPSYRIHQIHGSIPELRSSCHAGNVCISLLSNDPNIKHG